MERVERKGMKARMSLPDFVNMLGDEGYLNPVWLEQMMGLPTGWTELNPSVTEWFRNKRKRHS